MSAAVEELFGLVDHFKRRRRGFPQAVDAVPEDALPRRVLQRTPDVGSAPSALVRPAVAPVPEVPAVGMVPAPIEPPLTRPRSVAESAGLVARDAMENPDPGLTRPRRVEPTIDYTPIREEEGLPVNNLTRKRVADPLQYRADRVNEMESEGVPSRDNNGRLKSAGLGAWRGFQRGGLFGALFGALNGGVIDPAADEKEAYAGNLGRERGLLADAYNRKKGLQGLEEQQAETLLKRADAFKRLQPPKPDYQRVEGDDGYYQYDPMNPTAPALKLPIPAKQKVTQERNPFVQSVTLPDGSTALKQYDPVAKVWKDAPAEGGGQVKSAPKPDKLTRYQEESLKLQREGIVYSKQKEAAKDSKEAARYAGELENRYRTRAAQANELLANYARATEAAKSGMPEDKDGKKVTDPVEVEAYRKAMQREAQLAADQLEAFSDVVKVSKTVPGWPYVERRTGRSVADVMRTRKVDADKAVQMILDAGFVPVR